MSYRVIAAGKQDLMKRGLEQGTVVFHYKPFRTI